MGQGRLEELTRLLVMLRTVVAIDRDLAPHHDVTNVPCIRTIPGDVHHLLTLLDRPLTILQDDLLLQCIQTEPVSPVPSDLVHQRMRQLAATTIHDQRDRLLE